MDGEDVRQSFESEFDIEHLYTSNKPTARPFQYIAACHGLSNVLFCNLWVLCLVKLQVVFSCSVQHVRKALSAIWACTNTLNYLPSFAIDIRDAVKGLRRIRIYGYIVTDIALNVIDT